MKLLEMIRNLILNLPRLGAGNWWVEIVTSKPQCAYYFGPFQNSQEAGEQLPGYLEDLHQEGAEGITAAIKQCHPAKLTIFEDEAAWTEEYSPMN
jgi:hypothetical protein